MLPTHSLKWTRPAGESQRGARSGEASPLALPFASIMGGPAPLLWGVHMPQPLTQSFVGLHWLLLPPGHEVKSWLLPTSCDRNAIGKGSPLGKA